MLRLHPDALRNKRFVGDMRKSVDRAAVRVLRMMARGVTRRLAEPSRAKPSRKASWAKSSRVETRPSHPAPSAHEEQPKAPWIRKLLDAAAAEQDEP